MESADSWVALLDEDDDNIVFWQFGFDHWTQRFNLKCYKSVDEFWDDWATSARKPTLILMAELFPFEEEKNRLQAFLDHECCQQAKVFLVSDLIGEDEYEQYRQLGAADCFCCPTTLSELQSRVMALDHYAAQA